MVGVYEEGFCVSRGICAYGMRCGIVDYFV